MALIFSKEWREERRKKALEKLKADAMKKLYKAQAEPQNQAALHEACAAVLRALSRGADLDPNDPVFQNFFHAPWQREMHRTCHEPLDMRDATERRCATWGMLVAGAAIGCLITASFGVGLLPEILGVCIGAFLGRKAEQFCQKKEEVCQDTWDYFYDQIPDNKGNGGNGKPRNIILESPNKTSLRESLNAKTAHALPPARKRKISHIPPWLLKLMIRNRTAGNRRSGSDRKVA